MPDERSPVRPLVADPADALDMACGLATHVGLVREENEDNALARPDLGLFAVADGMGGHADGARASAAIVEALGSTGAAVSAADLLARVEDRLVGVNASLWISGGASGRVSGSTVALLLVFGLDFACAWAGDSRIYLLRAGALSRLTRDHTEARDLVERGILTPAEGQAWPRRNVITRAVGVAAELEIEVETGRIAAGDVFVICSDGLTGHVSDDEIRAVVDGRTPQATCDALVRLTLERGARDNVTVVVASFGAAPGPAGRGETVVQPRGGGPDPRTGAMP